MVISAGGTREFLDPVRYLGNRSSGRQGYALAEAAVVRGARVTVVSANVSLPDPAGADVVRVVSTEDMRRQVKRHREKRRKRSQTRKLVHQLQGRHEPGGAQPGL